MKRRERGFALLVVLWTLPLLTLIGAQLTAAGRFETRLAGNLRSAARAEAAADGAVREAIFRLSTGAWLADGQERRLRIGGDDVALRIEDHAGRINPNFASTALMAALLRQVGAEPGRLVRSIEQWRMESEALPAIAATYRAAGLGYAPTGKAFRSVAELGLVLGMTPRVLAALSPHLSVFNERETDPRLADPVVVAALRASGEVTDLARIGDPRARALVAGIEATAVDGGGGRFVRRAVARIAAVDGGNPKPWRVLTWETGE